MRMTSEHSPLTQSCWAPEYTPLPQDSVYHNSPYPPQVYVLFGHLQTQDSTDLPGKSVLCEAGCCTKKGLKHKYSSLTPDLLTQDP